MNDPQTLPADSNDLHSASLTPVPQPVAGGPNQPTPPPEPEKWSFLKKFFKILLIIIIVIALAGIAYVAWVFISVVANLRGDLSACSKGREQLFSNMQQITNDFNSLALVPSQANIKADMSKNNGDCVDSLPTIYGRKSYEIPSTPAVVVFDDISKELSKNGYTLRKRASSKSNPCTYKDSRYEYYKDDRNIEVILTCTSTISNDERWKQIPVTALKANLTVQWRYPNNK